MKDFNQEIQEGLADNDLVILTKPTIDRFLKEDNPGDLIALYTFYYYTSKWQHTNQPKCTTNYTAKGLGWTETRVRKIKKQLIELGLIEDISKKDSANKVTGWYIKMNYILKKKTVDEYVSTLLISTRVE